MLLLVWVSLPLDQAEVPGDEVFKGHVDRESLFTDSDDVVHA